MGINTIEGFNLTKRKADQSVEWTYERIEGDIIVHAVTALQALAIIREHGFIITDPARLKQTSKLGAPASKKGGIS